MQLQRTQRNLHGLGKTLASLALVTTLTQCGENGASKRRIVDLRYPTGNLRSVQEFLGDSTKDGLYISIYPNGVVEGTETYRSDQPDGLICAYYDNGILESRFELVDGEKEGAATWYYPNGKLRCWVLFRHGRKFTPGLIFREDGSLKAAINYAQDGDVTYRVDLNPDSTVAHEGGIRPANWEDLIRAGMSTMLRSDSAEMDAVPGLLGL